MTPKQAGQLLKWIDDLPALRRRYVLEGGRRRVFECVACGWKTEAETGPEALRNLASCNTGCAHSSIISHDDQPMPPHDFS